ncbi:MAG: hypothetical protein WD512_12395 [Candidatus Paceibacterota bacterium]
MTEIPKLVREIIKDYLSKIYSSNLKNWRIKMLYVNYKFYCDIQYTIYREFPANDKRKIAKVIYTIEHDIDYKNNIGGRCREVKYLIQKMNPQKNYAYLLSKKLIQSTLV